MDAAADDAGMMDVIGTAGVSVGAAVRQEQYVTIVNDINDKYSVCISVSANGVNIILW